MTVRHLFVCINNRANDGRKPDLALHEGGRPLGGVRLKRHIRFEDAPSDVQDQSECQPSFLGADNECVDLNPLIVNPIGKKILLNGKTGLRQWSLSQDFGFCGNNVCKVGFFAVGLSAHPDPRAEF